MEEITINNLNKIESLSVNSIIVKKFNNENFYKLMGYYELALNQVYNEIIKIKNQLFDLYNCDIISNVTKRIKTPESIINKMKKKNYDLTYRNLFDKIHDIAGIRVICQTNEDIKQISRIINQSENIRIIQTKDYIKHPKKSGYSGYHLIVKTPVKIEDEYIPMKVEIQLRTVAMDFWAVSEHKIRYKTNGKISTIDSKRLTLYAKLLDLLNTKISKLSHRYNY